MFKKVLDFAAKLFDAEQYTKRRLFIVAALLAAVVFRRPLVMAYDDYLIGPVLSKVKSSLPNDLAFGLVSLLIALAVVAKARMRYRPGFWQLVTLTVPSMLYLTTVLVYQGKLYDHKWYFTRFSEIPWLRYADVLLLLPIGVGSLSLIVMVSSVALWRKIGTQPASFLEGDTPASTPDTLGRTPEARRLIEQLLRLRSTASFAVGILGPWGAGKTKFLNLMEEQLTQLTDKPIVIRFNPWLVETTTAIRKEFFTTLKDRLSEYSGELANELNTYANGLAGVYDNTATKAFKEVVSFLSDAPPLTEQFKKVNEVIGRLNRQIFIFIDDIDRLDKDEVLETLRIVRNTANFQRTIFVLTYDKEYVIEAIRLTNQANSAQFLDKIIQLEATLPNVSSAVLAQRTLELVLRVVPVSYHAELTELIAGKNQTGLPPTLRDFMGTDPSRVSYYREVITTMRDAARFANLFNFDVLPLAGEVPLDELINLTLLKFRFAPLYDAIKTKRVLDTDYFTTSGSLIKINNKELSRFLKKKGTGLIDVELCKRMVKHLFAAERLIPGKRTIQRPSSFAIYFSAGNFSNVSLLAIEQLRTGPPANIDTLLDTWQRNGHLAEALEALEAIDTFDSSSDFENVVLAVLGAGHRLDTSVLNWLVRLNENQTNLIDQLYGGNATTLSNWLMTLLTRSPEPYYSNLISEIRRLYRRNPSYHFLLTDDQLGHLTYHYLTSYLSSHAEVDRIMFQLHWNNAVGVDERNHIITEARANSALRQALQTISSTALQTLLVPTYGLNGEQDYQTFQPFLDQIFGSWDEVERFLQQLPASSQATAIQEAFNRFKQAGYRPFPGIEGLQVQ